MKFLELAYRVLDGVKKSTPTSERWKYEVQRQSVPHQRKANYKASGYLLPNWFKLARG